MLLMILTDNASNSLKKHNMCFWFCSCCLQIDCMIFIIRCLILLFPPAEVMVTRTSSCQSDSSGFMEELPEPLVLQVRNQSIFGINQQVYENSVTLAQVTNKKINNHGVRKASWKQIHLPRKPQKARSILIALCNSSTTLIQGLCKVREEIRHESLILWFSGYLEMHLKMPPGPRGAQNKVVVAKWKW